jgi:hypothetical protein
LVNSFVFRVFIFVVVGHPTTSGSIILVEQHTTKCSEGYIVKSSRLIIQFTAPLQEESARKSLVVVAC